MALGGNVIISMKMRCLLTRVRWLEDYSSNQKKYRKIKKVLISVVLGALILAGLYALIGDVVLPQLQQRIIDMFNFQG